MRRAYKPTIKAISPAVISALDTARKLSSRIGHDPRASVPAYVVKSADGLVVVAVDDDALAGNLTQEIVGHLRREHLRLVSRLGKREDAFDCDSERPHRHEE